MSIRTQDASVFQHSLCTLLLTLCFICHLPTPIQLSLLPKHTPVETKKGQLILRNIFMQESQQMRYVLLLWTTRGPQRVVFFIYWLLTKPPLKWHKRACSKTPKCLSVIMQFEDFLSHPSENQREDYRDTQQTPISDSSIVSHQSLLKSLPFHLF